MRVILIGSYGPENFLLTIFVRDRRQCSDMGPSEHVYRHHQRLLAMLQTSIQGHRIGAQNDTTNDVESVTVQGKSHRHLQNTGRANAIQDGIARVLQN